MASATQPEAVDGLQNREPFAGHSPDQERPLGGYAILSGTFLTLTAAYATWIRRSQRPLPERISVGDLALITVATHKAARLISKDRVTSTLRAPFTRFQNDAGPGEVDEAARGHGLRLAIGELLICPYCIGMWIAAGLTGWLIVAPRAARSFAAVLTALFGADVLQIVYKRLESTLED